MGCMLRVLSGLEFAIAAISGLQPGHRACTNVGPWLQLTSEASLHLTERK